MKPVIDIHAHSVSGGLSAETVAKGLIDLRSEGLARLLLIMSPPFFRTTGEIAAMYPEVAQEVARRSDDFELSFGVKVLDALGAHRDLVTAYIGFNTYFPEVAHGAPFEPVRDVLDDLSDVVGGFKIHYFRHAPDHPMARHFGGAAWNQDRFDAFITRLLIEARERSLPAVIHVDLRDGGRPFVELLRPFSDLHLCICHFGYSRRLCGELLDELPWLVTDMSGIELHASMYQRLGAYHDFVTRYAERVLYGSDQYVCDSAELRRAWRLVDALELADDVDELVRYGNAERFLSQQR